MGLFYNYNDSGKGVAKNAPKKKAFFRFWELFAGKFWKIMYANLLYFAASGLLFVFLGLVLAGQTGQMGFIAFSAPTLILFGPATAALMQVMRKFVIEKPVFLFDEYKTAFVKNFKQSLPVGIFDVIFIALLSYGLVVYNDLLPQNPSTENYVMMALMVMVAVYIFMAHFYIYLEIVSLKLSLRAIVKNAFLLTVMGVKGNIVSFFVSLILGAAVYLTLPYSTLVLFVAPFGWAAFLIAFNSYPVIQKLIINPNYESRGERNPELPEEDESKAIFVDRGGSEAEIKIKKQARGVGKIIK